MSKTTTQFQERVYAALLKVPEGKITTYGNLARRLGIGSSQAIGQALRCNPYAPRVPCHRVVRSDGTIGGFNGHATGAEVRRKINLLAKEGIKVEGGRVVSFERVRV